MDLNHPLIQSLVLPLLLVFGLSAILRKAGGPSVTSMAIGIGLIVVTGLMLGLAWPHTAMQKLPYLLAASLLLGFALDRWPVGRGLVVVAALLWPLLVFLWLAAIQLRRPDSSLLLGLAALYGASLLVFWRLDSVRSEVTIPGAMVLSASLGLGGVAVMSASLSLGQLAFALAAAVGGFMLWNWPKPRDEFAWVGVFGAGGAWLILVGLILLLTDVQPLALAALGLVFFADTVSKRLPPKEGSLGNILRPVYLVLVALLPIAFALFMGGSASEDDYPYYSQPAETYEHQFPSKMAWVANQPE